MTAREEDLGRELGQAPGAVSKRSALDRGAVVVIAGVLGAAWGCVLASHSAAHTFFDARVYVQAMGRLVRGGDPYHTGPFNAPFVYPPSALPLLLPLAWIAVFPAGAILDGVSAAGFVYMVRRLREAAGWPVPERWAELAALVVVLVCVPGRVDLLLGQISILVLVLTVLGALQIPGDKPSGGWLLGAAAALKLLPAVLLVWAVRRRAWRVVVHACVTFALLTVLGAVFVGSTVVHDYRAASHALTALASSQPYRNISLAGAAHNWHARGAVEWSVLGLCDTVALVAAGLVVWQDTSIDVTIIALGLASVLLSPVSWDHHFGWLLVALILVACRLGAGRAERLCALAGAALLVPHAQNLAHAHLGPGPLRNLAVTCIPLMAIVTLGYLLIISRRRPVPVTR